MSDMPQPRHARLTAARALVRENPVLPVIAGIGFAVSFETITALARSQHMPASPYLYPVLIDVFLLGLVVEARKAIDDGRSDLVPRALAWVLAGFTLYVNAHGSPARDWLGIALHVTAPVAWITFLELTRWRKIRAKRKGKQDPVPLRRWVLSPLRTPGMWRRMVLHDITSYPVAVAREEARLVALDLARASLGKRWRSQAPALLVHHLSDGTLPAEVARVCDMASSGHRPAVAEAVDQWITEALTQRDKTAARVATEKRVIAATAEATSAPRPARKPARQRAATSWRDKAARAVASDSDIRAADLARRCGVTRRTAERYLKEHRATLPARLRVAGE